MMLRVAVLLFFVVCCSTARRIVHFARDEGGRAK